MSAATATAKPDAKPDEAPKKGKKKLIVMLALAVLLASGGGGGYFYWSKKKAEEAAAAAAEEDDEDAPAVKTVKKDKSLTPTFMPMDMFTLNLADKGTERFLQLGVTLELLNSKAGDELKAYMPAIRNNVLMLVAHKESTELQSEEGKRKLAKEIRAAALLPLGIEIEDEDDEDSARSTKDADDDKPNKKKKKKKRRTKPEYPVVAVHFSNFIIQ